MLSFFNSKGFKLLELTFFYLIIPYLVEQQVFGEGRINKGIPLITTGIIFLVVLLVNKDYDHKNLIKISSRYSWSNAAVRFFVIATIAFLFVYFYYNNILFNFAEEKPQNYLLFLLIYPIISVIPQEIIYRAYFFIDIKHYFLTLK